MFRAVSADEGEKKSTNLGRRLRRSGGALLSEHLPAATYHPAGPLPLLALKVGRQKGCCGALLRPPST